MERFVLANILADIDFDLLISDNVRNCRGYWGETIEIRFPESVIFAYVDENECGFIKLYELPEGKKTAEFSVTKDNLHDTMKNLTDKLKSC